MYVCVLQNIPYYLKIFVMQGMFCVTINLFSLPDGGTLVGPSITLIRNVGNMMIKESRVVP